MIEEYIRNGDIKNVKRLLESDECKFTYKYLYIALDSRQSDCILYLFDYKIKNKDELKYGKYYNGGMFDGEDFVTEFSTELIRMNPSLEKEWEVLKKCLEQQGKICYTHMNVPGAAISMNKLTLLKNMYNIGALDHFLEIDSESGHTKLVYILSVCIKDDTNDEIFEWVLEKSNYNLLQQIDIGNDVYILERAYKILVKDKIFLNDNTYISEQDRYRYLKKIMLTNEFKEHFKNSIKKQ